MAEVFGFGFGHGGDSVILEMDRFGLVFPFWKKRANDGVVKDHCRIFRHSSINCCIVNDQVA
jgi:hypothetical protein